MPLTAYWIWWEWPLQWEAGVIADLSGAVIGTAGFLILVLEATAVMVLFVPGRVKYLLEKGKAQAHAEARAEARAEVEKALEDAEVSDELKAKILSAIPTARESS